MRVLQPIKLLDATLTSNVTNDYPDWTAGEYTVGQRVVFGVYDVYEAVTTTSDQPDTGAAKETPTWFIVGRPNRWRMFRDGADSITTETGGIDVTIDNTPTISAVGLLGLKGYELEVTLTDGAEVVYSHEQSLVDIGIDDWWEYYFTDYEDITRVYLDGLPPYPGSDLRIEVKTLDVGDDASCGRVVYGVERTLGTTLEGVSSRLEDYSIKSRNAFGSLELIPRRVIRVVNYDLAVEPFLVDPVQRRFQALAATPTLYVGEPTMPETIVFGVFEDFQQLGINGYFMTECSASVEEF